MLNEFKNLPGSEQLNTFALSKLFLRRTTSYKYLFFISILDIIKRKKFNISSQIQFKEIVIEMLANAWYPHNYFKLSFGTQDTIADKLDSLKLDISEPILNFRDFDKTRLRKTISEQNLDETVAKIVLYVPFRLITPFFKKELKGVDVDHGVDKETPRLSKIYFESHKPLYCFNSTEKTECNSIILHPEWVLYLQQNYLIVRGWVCWKWLEYMQSCNPNVPAIASKLFPPLKRESLISQTKYWKQILENIEFKCIYSNLTINKDSFSLDHYLPWSFVAHDQLWNLIPTTKSVNSAKSNNIPDTDKYFNEFVKAQHLGIKLSYDIMKPKDWNDYIKPYLLDLRIPDKNSLLNVEILENAYQSTFFPLISLASSQGFISEWFYQ